MVLGMGRPQLMSSGDGSDSAGNDDSSDKGKDGRQEPSSGTRSNTSTPSYTPAPSVSSLPLGALGNVMGGYPGYGHSYVYTVDAGDVRRDVADGPSGDEGTRGSAQATPLSGTETSPRLVTEVTVPNAIDVGGATAGQAPSSTQPSVNATRQVATVTPTGATQVLGARDAGGASSSAQAKATPLAVTADESYRALPFALAGALSLFLAILGFSSSRRRRA